MKAPAPGARRGYDAAKKTVVRKRHVAVDTDRLLLMVNLTPADISDSAGAQIPLSLRQGEDLLFERGIDICHETVRFCGNRFAPYRIPILSRALFELRVTLVPQRPQTLTSHCTGTGPAFSHGQLLLMVVNAGCGGQPRGDVQASTSGTLQAQSKCLTRKHIRYQGLNNFSEGL